jgi:hypothetical protein
MNNNFTHSSWDAIGVEGLPGAELDLGALDKQITLEPQQRLRVWARVRVPPQPGEGGQRHFDFVITPLGEPEADPVRRSASFSMPE